VHPGPGKRQRVTPPAEMPKTAKAKARSRAV